MTIDSKPKTRRQDKALIEPFRLGMRHGIVYFPILAPFSLLFGIFASDLDLTMLETMGFSLGVFAGASQFASLSLLNDGAPIAIALLAGVTLNLRFFLYSATLAPHFQGLTLSRRAMLAYLLVDQVFVLSDNQFARTPEWNAWQKSRYYFGVMSVITLPWHFFTLLGYTTGNLIPETINISFALPLSFIALIAPAIKSRPHLLAAVISVIGALLLKDLPYNLGLILAGALAIFAAGRYESLIEEKR